MAELTKYDKKQTKYDRRVSLPSVLKKKIN